MTKTGVVIQARMGSTRLPGKVLKPLGPGTNVTEFIIKRLRTSRRADGVVVATSDDPRDDILCQLAAAQGVSSFKGSQDDKLIRYRDSAHAHGYDFVVIVDGDDPFVSIAHIDRIIEYAEKTRADLVMFGNLPVGATGFGLRTSALERVCAGRGEENTEIWGNLFRRNPAFVCVDLVEDAERARLHQVDGEEERDRGERRDAGDFAGNFGGAT